MIVVPVFNSWWEVWQGSDYLPGKGLLILGESWYGDATETPSDEKPIDDFIHEWIAKGGDWTFSRIFNICSGEHTSTASESARKAFWNSVAFCNYVSGSVGPNRRFRPMESQFGSEEIVRRLGDILDRLRPAGVWILGRGQAEFSEKVIRERSGMACTVARHPAYRRVIHDEFELSRSWQALQAKLR